ncbi:MAG: bifunctional diaminohydroxyphosphoribosylaminopyrimidine deaminase/5-amino-6-(5-phosphoribosylamino)uracil reductase RibD [Acidobacteria bacterium]|nr:bifunctional diaminohydroxyphosphoribosylaminopyrimidine deaminase/5-amino-6-(5-phosphoribosylamino)uracil reductase RibD [Acidobacteriota bacterium]MCI0717548.1 bifunctional diaminohydroxyphosphoribosylaminopyrimidine deaminase/5-amino-6-(5-phosphoribosylamino)uracil reductase RibD [Acidobacteriota bacterium]
MPRATDNDERFVRYALELAGRGCGLVSPNPMVGAVLVRDGQIVGEGFHRYQEQKHAETWALEHAGSAAQGSTLFVNLEPCSHQGRTPPCTGQLIRAGVARVVAAMLDPNPLVAGSGFQSLQAAGITVEAGVCEAEASKLNEAYGKFIQTRLPFVTLKAGMTLDGKIAQADGRSQWITEEASRQRVQQLRFESDALLTGVGTLLADDPLLTDRTGLPRRRRLLRAVLDVSLRLSPDSRLVRSRDEGEILAFCGKERRPARQRQLEELGVEVVPVAARDGKVDLPAVLRELGRRDVTSVLIEAGPALNFEALRSGCVDKLLCFVGPRILGGHSPLPLAGGEGFVVLDQALRLRFASVERLGDDLLVEAYVAAKQESAAAP